MRKLAWGLLLLSSAAWAQVSPEAPKEFVVQDHTGGLFSYYSGQRLEPNQANDVTNAFFDKDLGVVKRTGQALYGNVPRCTSAVRSGAAYKTSGGADEFFVACDTNVFITSGDGQFAVHGSTINSTARVRFTQALGKEWGADGVDAVWNSDGVTVSSPTQAPAASLIGSYKSRIVLANWAGNRSSVYLSGFADGTDYTIPAVIVDTSPFLFYLNGPNDGRGITCLFDGYRDVLILWNEDQMFGLYGNGYNTFVLRKLAEVGCSEQESVKEYEGKLKWLSKYGIYEYNGSNYGRISDPVKDLVSNIIGSDSSVLSLIQTLQSDWQQGNTTVSGPGAPMSTTISPGNVVPTTWTVEEANSNSWGTGTGLTDFSTSGVVGPLTMAVSTFSFTNGSLNQASFTNWTQGGAWSISGISAISSCDPIWMGSGVKPPSNVDSTGIKMAAPPTCSGSASPTHTVELLDGSDNLLKSCTISYSCSGGLCTYSGGTCQCSTSGGSSCTGLTSYMDVGMDVSTFTNLTSMKLKFIDNLGNYLVSVASTPAQTLKLTVDNTACAGLVTYSPKVTACGVRQYVRSSTYTSAEFNTGLSTPTFGTFSSTTTLVSNDVTVTYRILTSASSGGSYTTFNQAENTKVSATPNQFIKYQILLDHARSGGTGNVIYSTAGASISDTSLSAATTGYFITTCFNVGNITSWDLFQANSVDNGGSLSFWVSTGTSCGAATSPTGLWTSQANNTLIAVDTASYIGVRILFSLDIASETPTLQDITINFKQGAGRPALASAIYDNRYWMAFTTNTSPSAYNDTVLVYDNNGKWTKLTGINASALLLYKRKLYSGSGLGDGNVNVQDTGTTDFGNSIYFRFKTPDYDLGTFADKSLYDLTAEFLPTNDLTKAATINVNYYADKSTTAYSLGNFSTYQTTNGILRDTMRFGKTTDPIKIRTISVEYNSTSTSPLTLYRTMIRYLPLEFW